VTRRLVSIVSAFRGFFDKARQQFEAGKYKAACRTLEEFEYEVRGGDNVEGAQGLLDLASALRERTTGSIRDECDELVGHARRALNDADDAATRSGAMAVIPDCRLVGGCGFVIERPSDGTWDLIFKDDRVLVRQVVPHS
jgi:hypothetical protein